MISSKKAHKGVWISLFVIAVLIAVAFYTTRSEFGGLKGVTGMAAQPLEKKVLNSLEKFNGVLPKSGTIENGMVEIVYKPQGGVTVKIRARSLSEFRRSEYSSIILSKGDTSNQYVYNSDYSDIYGEEVYVTRGDIDLNFDEIKKLVSSGLIQPVQPASAAQSAVVPAVGGEPISILVNTISEYKFEGVSPLSGKKYDNGMVEINYGELQGVTVKIRARSLSEFRRSEYSSIILTKGGTSNQYVYDSEISDILKEDVYVTREGIDLNFNEIKKLVSSGLIEPSGLIQTVQPSPTALGTVAEAGTSAAVTPSSQLPRIYFSDLRGNLGKITQTKDGFTQEVISDKKTIIGRIEVTAKGEGGGYDILIKKKVNGAYTSANGISSYTFYPDDNRLQFTQDNNQYDIKITGVQTPVMRQMLAPVIKFDQTQQMYRRLYNVDVRKGLQGLATLDWLGQAGFMKDMARWFETDVIGRAVSDDLSELLCTVPIESARKEGILITETPAGLMTTGAHIEGIRAEVERPVLCNEPECRLTDCGVDGKPDCDICLTPNPTEIGTCFSPENNPNNPLNANPSPETKTGYIYKITFFITNPQQSIGASGSYLYNNNPLEFNVKLVTSRGAERWLYIDERTKERRDKVLQVGESVKKAGENARVEQGRVNFKEVCLVINGEGAENLGVNPPFNFCREIKGVASMSSEGYQRPGEESEAGEEGEEEASNIIENPEWI